jgi:hypothetical protein
LWFESRSGSPVHGRIEQGKQETVLHSSFLSGSYNVLTFNVPTSNISTYTEPVVKEERMGEIDWRINFDIGDFSLMNISYWL